MPTYTLCCDDCEHLEEYFFPLSAWNGLDTSKGEVPYPTSCPKCKSKKYHREMRCNIAVKADSFKQQENLKKQVREDLEKVKKGDANTILDIAGNGSTSSKVQSGVKYMNDVTKGGFKRK